MGHIGCILALNTGNSKTPVYTATLFHLPTGRQVVLNLLFTTKGRFADMAKKPAPPPSSGEERKKRWLEKIRDIMSKKKKKPKKN